MTRLETLKSQLNRLGDRVNAIGCCPVCGDPDGNVTVYRDPIHYTLRCWRGSCGAVTRIPAESLASGSTERDEFGFPKSNEYTGETFALARDHYAYFLRVYGIGADTLDRYGVRACDDRPAMHATLLLPVRNRSGGTIGHVLHRQNPTFGQPKRLAFKENFASPWMAYYQAPANSAAAPVVIVEDQLSAMRLAQAGCNAVALLGVSLDNHKVHDMQRAFGKHERFALALDSDVFNAAVALTRKWPTITAIYIGPDDVKDMHPPRFYRTVSEIERVTGRTAVEEETA